MSTSVRWDPTRQQKHGDRMWQRPCPQCNHPSGRHHELQSTWEPVMGDDGVPDVVEVKHPDYEPLAFHCDECDCIRRMS